MTNEDNSPDPDITIRSPRRSMPNFSDIPLPSPLRELQKSEESTAPATPRPSEFTALAVRLRKIRLDTSPTDANSSGSPVPQLSKPLRLQFDDEDPSMDKENVDNRASLSDVGRLFKPSKPAEHNTDVSSVFRNPFLSSEVSEKHGGETQANGDEDAHQPGELVDSFVPEEIPNSFVDNIDTSVKTKEEVTEDFGPQGTPTSFVDNIDTSVGTNEEFLLDAEAILSPIPPSNGISDMGTVAHSPASPIPEIATPDRMHEAGKGVACTESDSTLAKPSAEYNNTLSEYTNDAPDNSGIGANVEKPEQTDDVENALGSSPKKVELTVGTPTCSKEVAPLKQSTTEYSEAGVAHEADAGHEQPMKVDPVLEEFETNLNIITEGQGKWPWQKRCEAMAAVTAIISTNLSKSITAAVQKRLPTFSMTIDNNLDELRPSIMSSALHLVNAIVTAQIDRDSNFAQSVFPSIMDLACGRSITSKEGARAVALVLDYHPELSGVLEDADNPDRLRELLESDEKSEVTGPEIRSRARKAFDLLRKALRKNSSPEISSTSAVDIAISPSSGRGDASLGNSVEEKLSSPVISPSLLERAKSANRRRNARFSQRLNAISGTPGGSKENFTPKSFTRRSFQMTPSDLKTSPRHSIRLASEGHPATPVVRNMKLGDSVRKISPGSRRKRIYTEEDMEEARRAAMRAIMEETAEAHRKEREKFQAEKVALEKMLGQEKSECAELKEVLGEYEQTMQKMVSQGNTQASAYCASLEKETKRLKAELLEVTETYENVKERYDTAKQTLKVYENKESRFIEQIRDLKRNMAELQKWSNDLKANTEKKLTKAFESVTTYRASFIDIETRFSKANSDLERLRSELEKEVAKHVETAASLSSLESSLHSEQDTRSSLEASLATSKASISRMSTQKGRLQKELDETKVELKRLSAEVSKLKEADVRARNATKRLESYIAERQSLKARAYDDMNRIQELEREVKEKQEECIELSAICEESVSELENMKAREKATA